MVAASSFREAAPLAVARLVVVAAAAIMSDDDRVEATIAALPLSTSHDQADDSPVVAQLTRVSRSQSSALVTIMIVVARADLSTTTIVPLDFAIAVRSAGRRTF